MIMAHNQWTLLIHLLKALDYEYNDLYLHLDKKMGDVDYSQLYSQLKYAKLYILTNRLDVTWGNYSQIQCEMNLLAEATKTKHLYYHLMSGVDFPLKSQQNIHAFFRENYGTEFVQFEAKKIDKKIQQRVSKYHFNTKRLDDKTLFDRIVYRILMTLQLRVNRIQNTDIIFQKGANWFSITEELAKYVLGKQDVIEKWFRYTLCGDEMFLQTIVFNSPFREKIAKNNFCDNNETILYCIDWTRGKPYEYTEEDYNYLIDSGMLFARKFNWEKDYRIILKLLDLVYEDK